MIQVTLPSPIRLENVQKSELPIFAVSIKISRKELNLNFFDSVAEATVTTTFKPSQVMSSYLLAFVVSDFETISNEDFKKPGDTLHRIWVRSDLLDRTRWSLNNSIQSLDALEAYIGFNYEFPELQSIGVPMQTGGMENWGLVTYPESSMVTYEAEEDIPHKTKVSSAGIIAHENAHQFFGDSVTCEWWDYIW